MLIDRKHDAMRQALSFIYWHKNNLTHRGDYFKDTIDTREIFGSLLIIAYTGIHVRRLQ